MVNGHNSLTLTRIERNTVREYRNPKIMDFGSRSSNLRRIRVDQIYWENVTPNQMKDLIYARVYCCKKKNEKFWILDPDGVSGGPRQG